MNLKESKDGIVGRLEGREGRNVIILYSQKIINSIWKLPILSKRLLKSYLFCWQLFLLIYLYVYVWFVCMCVFVCVGTVCMWMQVPMCICVWTWDWHQESSLINVHLTLWDRVLSEQTPWYRELPISVFKCSDHSLVAMSTQHFHKVLFHSCKNPIHITTKFENNCMFHLVRVYL